jgi:hypothetical protein
MPGGFMPVKGSSIPPNKVFFGGVADQFTMLSQFYSGNSGVVYYGLASVPLVSQWQLYNENFNSVTNNVTASFGATTLAPDGTTNGIKVVDTTSNSVHAVVSGYQDGSEFFYKLRVSVFAKAAEYTRFALYTSGGNFDVNHSPGRGAKIVFDVAGGQVGVTPSAYGGGTFPFGVPVNPEIVSFGNGWQRCSVDFIMGQGISGLSSYEISILLDSGSGTAAESTSFAGTGSKGMYFWRATAMPPGAWGVNTVTFFDDFTSLSTLDMAKTGNPGFNWYIKTTWPEGSFNYDIAAASLSITGGTLLTFTPQAQPAGVPDIVSATPSGGSWNLGRAFRLHGLFECKMSWNLPGYNVGNASTMFAINLEHLVDNSAFGTGVDRECDFFEAKAGLGNYPSCTQLNQGTIYINAAATGWVKWNAGQGYGNTVAGVGPPRVVYSDNNIYTAIGTASNIGNIPPSSPSFWSVYSSLSPFPNPYSSASDVSVLNNYQTLYLDQTPDDYGHIVNFFNGAYCNSPSEITGRFGHQTFGYLDASYLYRFNNTSASQPAQQPTASKWLTFPLIFGIDCNTGEPGGSVDFIRVTQ